MANISTYTGAIESAARGEEVRDAIVSALNAINDDYTFPTPSQSDAGKFLRVDSDGEWELSTVPSAEEVSF